MIEAVKPCDAQIIDLAAVWQASLQRSSSSAQHWLARLNLPERWRDLPPAT